GGLPTVWARAVPRPRPDPLPPRSGRHGPMPSRLAHPFPHRQGRLMTTTIAEPEADRSPAAPAPAAHEPSQREARGARRGGWSGFLRGRPRDPAWVRPCLLLLLVGTGLLYLWGLGASGWANTYYSAAVQA